MPRTPTPEQMRQFLREEKWRIIPRLSASENCRDEARDPVSQCTLYLAPAYRRALKRKRQREWARKRRKGK